MLILMGIFPQNSREALLSNPQEGIKGAPYYKFDGAQLLADLY